MKCENCGASIRKRKGEAYYGDAGTYYEGKPLCEACYYESEECAVVFYGGSDYAPLGEECPHEISDSRNETDGEFTVKWVSTDPWRGYYEVESKVYEKVHDDCILSGSVDAEQLKRFDRDLIRILEKLGVRYARVFARSSNVFSQGYEVWVHKDDLGGEKGLAIKAAIGVLALRYRDSVRFRITALTGKTNPEEFSEEDRLLAEVSKRLAAGENPEDVEKELFEKPSGKEGGGEHGVEEDR
jgi:hypothetical protein